jgi:uncharacterized membrane protein
MVPGAYVATSIVCALTLPRLEHEYLRTLTAGFSVASTQAYLSAVASGMMALTAIVFAIAFVVVQFNAVAYSPRVVLWFVRDRKLFHVLGIFFATFIFSLWTLAWTDVGGSGTVPILSVFLVAVLVIVSALLFAKLIDRLNDLQINNVLHSIGDGGREVIQAMFRPLNIQSADLVPYEFERHGHVSSQPQIIKYRGPPRTVTSVDIDALVRLAQQVQGVIEMTCAVGDTLVDGQTVFKIEGVERQLPEASLLQSIHVATERTFEQDPKYPIRLLVDIAIKALSPAINDPTTAVQTIDQIEDLLRRLGRCELNVGRVRDSRGVLRLLFPVPTWDDYIELSFDEIRQYGSGSVQVMRRLRSALVGVAESIADETRVNVIRRYLAHLDTTIDRSPLDQEDRTLARQEDRQGIGLSRKTVRELR